MKGEKLERVPDTDSELYHTNEWIVNETIIESRPKAFKERMKLEKSIDEPTSFSFNHNELNAALLNTAW